MKKIGLALVVFLATSSLVFGYETQFYAPRPDGEYDNHNILVNPEEKGIERMTESVVRIVTAAFLKSDMREFSAPDIRSVGGVVIAGRYVLTAGHGVATDEITTGAPFQGTLTEPAHKVSEIFIVAGTERRSSIQLKLLYVNRDIDFALFELPENGLIPSFPYALGKSSDLRVGNYLYILGYPLALGVNVRDGIVNALSMPDAWYASGESPNRSDYFMMSVGLVPNDSGTALVGIRDGRYELVGIAVSMASYNNLGMAVRIDSIRKDVWEECATCPDDLRQFFEGGKANE